jgi:hypothetical protein
MDTAQHNRIADNVLALTVRPRFDPVLEPAKNDTMTEAGTERVAAREIFSPGSPPGTALARRRSATRSR